MKPSALRPILAALLCACAGSHQGPKEAALPTPSVAPAHVTPGSFGDDCAFLAQHTPLIVLQRKGSAAQVAVAPAYQGRVMTSSASGADGISHGYLHREVIAKHERQPHMTVLGGEDRFWLGPEAGQYALYFAPGSNFDFEHWRVPEPIDWDAWPVTQQSEHEVSFTRDMAVNNYASTHFTLRVQRTIRLLDDDDITRALAGRPGPGVRAVGYESDNRLENRGSVALRKNTGLVSIWILGMFKPGPHVTLVVPYIDGSANQLGPIVNDAYFGSIPQKRLAVGDKAIFMRGDGQQRGKIGVPQKRARPIAGSYDPDSHTLTLVQFSMPQGPADYVSSVWQHQSNPYAGDVVNGYNDGPPSAGVAPLGPFYELESSSPAVELAPGESIRHVHRTFHLEGPDADLDIIARNTLGVTLAEITHALH